MRPRCLPKVILPSGSPYGHPSSVYRQRSLLLCAYLASCSGALRSAAGAVRVLVLLEIHEGVPLALHVRLVDVVQGLQAFSGHGAVPSVQGG